MKVLKNIILVAISLISTSAFSQLDFSRSAVKLDTAVNSEYSDLAPVFSRDGKTMYFHRLNHPENRYGLESQDIWYSKMVDGNWTSAIRCANSLNLNRYNAVYSIIEDGRLVINGRYIGKGDFAIRGMSLITPIGDSTFSKPEPFMVKAYKRKSDGDIASVYLNDSSTVMITSYGSLNQGKKNNLYVSYRKKNKFTKPKKLQGISKKKSQEMPFVSSDGETLYYASNEGNDKGNYDLYSASISEPGNYREWSEGIKIEGDINSDSFDGFLVVDPAEEYAYFTSSRDNGSKSDIYRIQLKELEGSIFVKGFVKDIESGESLPKGTPYAIQVSKNDTVIDVAKLLVKRDSSYFEFEVPYGYKYDVVAIASGYETVPVSLDFVDFNSPQEFLQDANVKLIKPDTITLVDTVTQVQIDTITQVDTVEAVVIDTMVDVTGKISGVDDYDFIAVYVNGFNYGTPKMDKNGNYSMELPKGKKYDLIAKKLGYEDAVSSLDLSNKEVEKATVNYNLKKKDIVSLLDIKVLNRKDSSYIKSADYDVYLDGKKLSTNDYELNEKGFKMDLKVGASYFLMVKSNDFIESHDSIDFSKVKERFLVNKKFYLVPLEEGETVQVKNIYFDLSKSTLRPESFVELDLLTQIMNDHPLLKIEVSGHTDNRGSASFNKKLSGDRALSVMTYLIEKGIDSSRMTSKGYGFDKPIAPNDTEENRAQNRRVEFTILSNKK